MKTKIQNQVRITTLTIILLAAPLATAQATTTHREDAPLPEHAPGEIISAPAVPIQENTLDSCRDAADNDRDGFVDCADQDCAIYAICAVTENQEKASEGTPPPADSVQIFERGRMCKDGIDNDNNGLADCHDTKCQPTRYCRKVMYEYPRNPNKAPGPFFQFGAGLALPNFNWKDTRVDSQYGNNIPFDPDLGGIMNFKAGVLALPWFGFGININAGGTFGTNRADFFSVGDLDDKYKYDGYKVFGHVGGFVRFQYPARRFVTYMDIGGGYSFARYKWHVFDADESWDSINSNWDDDDWENNTDVEFDTKYKQGHHFSLVLEPGFDYFFIDRTVGAGIRAWLPVVSSADKGMDNIGIMFNVTFTPTWRDPKRLKEEYR